MPVPRSETAERCLVSTSSSSLRLLHRFSSSQPCVDYTIGEKELTPESKLSREGEGRVIYPALPGNKLEEEGYAYAFIYLDHVASNVQ